MCRDGYIPEFNVVPSNSAVVGLISSPGAVDGVRTMHFGSVNSVEECMSRCSAHKNAQCAAFTYFDSSYAGIEWQGVLLLFSAQVFLNPHAYFTYECHVREKVTHMKSAQSF